MRMAVWESPFPQIAPFKLAVSPPPAPFRGGPTAQTLAHGDQAIWSFAANGPIAPPKPVTVEPVSRAFGQAAGRGADKPAMIASHQMLFLAAMAQVPVPADIARLIQDRAANPDARSPASGAERVKSGRRWSVDSWLFLRPDATLAANTGARFASYGASQAGAVLRYRLKPGSAARPAAYVRATKALAAGREREFAAGLAARPIPGVPIAAYAELRATRGAVTSELRPPAFAVTEFPPVDLPLSLRGETYLAAGYVGGDFATPFVDGQARIDGEIARFDLGTLRAGAGVWGGAQQGAARLDVGPSASLNVNLGTVPARLALDYRLRAAGDAEPGSGVAITLSTGF